MKKIKSDNYIYNFFVFLFELLQCLMTDSNFKFEFKDNSSNIANSKAQKNLMYKKLNQWQTKKQLGKYDSKHNMMD